MESATDQGARPPQAKQSHVSEESATEDGLQSRDLWMNGYETLRLRDTDLVTAYERHLASADIGHAASTFPSLSPELIGAIVTTRLKDHEAGRLVLRLGREPIKVREQIEKILRFVLWSSDLVSAAVSAQPYAALAWSGVSVLLPVSCCKIQIHTSNC